ncbi:MAG: ABC transporter substrate-binding protein [Deltaproteobacteria bacterium]|nr:ABC transporter substrate-binding protein [Deltaproteobacteria bacterium]
MRVRPDTVPQTRERDWLVTCARWAGLVLLAVLVGLPRPGAAAERLTVGLTSLIPSTIPLYLAKEQGFFDPEGLAVQIPVFSSGTQNVQAMLAGDVQVAFGSIEVLNLKKVGRDARFFWGIHNTMPFRLYSRPEIRSGKDLRGKRLAVSRFGAQSDTLTRYVLQHFGIEPVKEAAILQIGSTPARYAALKSGAVDATIMWFPQTLIADREGFRKLLDLSEIITEWQYMAYFAPVDYLRTHRDRVVRFLRGYLRGVRLAKQAPEEAIRLLMKVLKYPRDVAEAGYQEFVPSIPEDGRLALRGIEFLIDAEVKGGRLERRYSVQELVDPSFIEQLARGRRAE